MRRPTPPARYKATNHTSYSGGYGIVEIWHDEMLDRDVAIKWIISTRSESELLNEWRILATTTSRHVIEIYDLIFDNHGALHGIIMEYINGKTLAEIRSPTTEVEIPNLIKLLYQLAIGLTDLHRNNIVHRDIKPENAIKSSDGHLRICDFGISSPPNTITQNARSTMGYIAPELICPPTKITYKCDVYAFGVVCWKIFTGGLPPIGPYGFPDRNHFPVKSISHEIQIPTPVSEVIDKCLSWNPIERPDMEEVSKTFRDELIKNQHIGLISTANNQTILINKQDNKRKLSAGSNSIAITYNGYKFTIEQVNGSIYINNCPAKIGDFLQEACLLTFGEPNEGANRAFAPFRQFTPEVII